jgi:hypothetical protein
MGDILKYGLLAVGGYLLYNAFVSGSTATAAASPDSAPPPAAPSPATIAALKTWAASQDGYDGKFSSDVWHWAWVNVLKKAPVPDANFFAVFPGGTPPMTPEAFVSALQSQGLSGLGRSIPRVITAPAAAAVAIARARQLRNAGVRNYQLAGTPMPKGAR